MLSQSNFVMLRKFHLRNGAKAVLKPCQTSTNMPPLDFHSMSSLDQEEVEQRVRDLLENLEEEEEFWALCIFCVAHGVH